MGMAPDSVRRMSLFQFGAVVEGWNKAHGGGDAEGPVLTDREADEIGARLNAPPVWVH